MFSTIPYVYANIFQVNKISGNSTTLWMLKMNDRPELKTIIILSFCVYVYKHTYAWAHMWGLRTASGIDPQLPPCLRQCLSWIQCCVYQINWPESLQIPSLPLILLLMFWYHRWKLPYLALCGFWGPNFTFSCLNTKHFNHWSSSQNLVWMKWIRQRSNRTGKYGHGCVSLSLDSNPMLSPM